MTAKLPVLLALTLLTAQAYGEPQTRAYADFREYEMPRDAEVALARSAAPEKISSRATIEVLTRSPAAIAQEVALRYGRGELPKMESVAFAYMWSANQDTGPGFGHWHPHMMVFAPYYENAMLGGNKIGDHSAPFVVGGGTPYSVALIVVDEKYAIQAKNN